MDEPKVIYETELEKPPFSRVGWTLFAILGIATLLQVVAEMAARVFAPYLFETSWFIWALSFVPLYFVAIPLGYIIIRPVPKLITPKHKLGFGKLMGFLAMSFAVMYIGNLVGIIINTGISALKGEELINPLTQLMDGSNLYIELLVVALLAPFLEELIFRKVLLDRIRVYGEGTAILISGLTFGLFHGNLFQFFYAFGLGSLFAYIYLRTGKLRYTVILHAAINSYSVILSQLLIGNSDTEALGNLDSEDFGELIKVIQNNLPQYIGISICVLVAVTLFIVGIVLLITKRKQAVLFQAPKELRKGERFRTVFINWGMALFVLLALGLMVYTAIVL